MTEDVQQVEEEYGEDDNIKYLLEFISKDMTGEEWEEREEILEKLEDVTTYLKDALGKGIEF